MQVLFGRLTRALGLAVVLALSACGGGGESGPPPANLLQASIATFKGTGVWWSPEQPGSGFFFEAQGATAVVTFYLYETNGRPVWYSGVGTLVAGAGEQYTFSTQLQRYSNGQTDGSSVQKTPVSTAIGSANIAFDGFKAQVQLPGGRSFAAQKYSQAAPNASATQPEAGIFWNAGESGRGYTIEVTGNSAAVTVCTTRTTVSRSGTWP